MQCPNYPTGGTVEEFHDRHHVREEGLGWRGFSSTGLLCLYQARSIPLFLDLLANSESLSILFYHYKVNILNGRFAKGLFPAFLGFAQHFISPSRALMQPYYSALSYPVGLNKLCRRGLAPTLG